MILENPHKCCLLCSRPLAEPFNKHHLIPVSQGGKGTPTVELHKICHEKVHSVFSEKELGKNYNTIEKLLSNDEIQIFLKWISKQPYGFYSKSRKKNRKK